MRAGSVPSPISKEVKQSRSPRLLLAQDWEPAAAMGHRARHESGSGRVSGYWLLLLVAFMCRSLAKVEVTWVYSTAVAAVGTAGLGTVPGERCHGSAAPPASCGAQTPHEG